MAKKVKRELVPTNDPNLENVEEDRSFEIEYDEETNEVVFVHHYRRHWGDGFDADTEHGLDIDETNRLIYILMEMLEAQKKNIKTFEEKQTLSLTEKNPLQDNNKT